MVLKQFLQWAQNNTLQSPDRNQDPQTLDCNKGINQSGESAHYSQYNCVSEYDVHS